MDLQRLGLGRRVARVGAGMFAAALCAAILGISLLATSEGSFFDSDGELEAGFWLLFSASAGVALSVPLVGVGGFFAWRAGRRAYPQHPRGTLLRAAAGGIGGVAVLAVVAPLLGATVIGLSYGAIQEVTQDTDYDAGYQPSQPSAQTILDCFGEESVWTGPFDPDGPSSGRSPKAALAAMLTSDDAPKFYRVDPEVMLRLEEMDGSLGLAASMVGERPNGARYSLSTLEREERSGRWVVTEYRQCEPEGSGPGITRPFAEGFEREAPAR